MIQIGIRPQEYIKRFFTIAKYITASEGLPSLIIFSQTMNSTNTIPADGYVREPSLKVDRSSVGREVWDVEVGETVVDEAAQCPVLAVPRHVHQAVYEGGRHGDDQRLVTNTLFVCLGWMCKLYFTMVNGVTK